MKHFVLLLTFLFVVSCGQQQYYVTKIEGKKSGITNQEVGDPTIEAYIKPYRENIDKDLNTILAYCPETLDKSKGEWQTNIGNFLADITLERSNPIFLSREQKNIDVCLLNHGGIRTIIPKGNVSARTAFEVMPFENKATVIALKGEQMEEIANYLLAEKKPHPLAGMTFTISKENTINGIQIQGQPLHKNQVYYVVTNDYLANGGDNMTFFKKGTQRYDLDYKLRNIMIDYFKDVDTLKIKNDRRILKE